MLDSGTEINVLDKLFAMSVNIGITITNEGALTANKLPLYVYGQITSPVSIECLTLAGYITIRLGIVLIV